MITVSDYFPKVGLAWAVKLQVNPRIIRLQDMRRKWGSCSSAGTVTLASDLVDQDQRAHVPGWRKLAEQRGTSLATRGSRSYRSEYAFQ